MASEMNQDAPQSNGKATGGLKPATALLVADATDAAAPSVHPHFIRSLALRFAEQAISPPRRDSSRRSWVPAARDVPRRDRPLLIPAVFRNLRRGTKTCRDESRH